MKNLYIVKVLGAEYSYEKYVIAKTKKEAEEKAKKRYRFSAVRVIEELGEVI